MNATTLPNWLTTLLSIPGLILFCTFQLANYMGSPRFSAKVDPELFRSLGLAERNEYFDHWKHAKAKEFEKMKYVQACDQMADDDDNDHFLWSIKDILKLSLIHI